MDKVDDSGGGQIAFTKTKAEIDTLIAGGDLVAGALYEITGVHPTLYDDGTTSGTTVYLRAISGSELEVQGMGKFYNPKYNQAVMASASGIIKCMAHFLVLWVLLIIRAKKLLRQIMERQVLC